MTLDRTAHSTRNRFARMLLLAGGCVLAGSALQAVTVDGPDLQAEPWIISPRRAATPNPVPKTPQAVTQGQDLYKDECATCHGQRGQNDGPGAKKIAAEMKAALVLTDSKVQEQSDGALYWKITEGRNKMPGLEKDLSDTERWQIVHYLRTLAPAAR
jgi:mono/diheme cytochrome c family protein